MPLSHQVIIYFCVLTISNILIFYLLRDKKSDKLSNKKSIRSKEPVVNIKKRLEEIRERILIAVAEHSGIEDNELAKRLSIGTDVVAFHLEELREPKFVKAVYIMGSVWDNIPSKTEWSIDHLGRKYLVHHKLIK